MYKPLGLILLLQAVFWLPLAGFSQYVIEFNNPSLEGPPQADNPPPGWIGHTTPDTQPGFWGISRAPSDGKSFVSIVTRDDRSNPTEGILQTLQDSFQIFPSWYYFTLDIVAQPRYFSFPIRLKVKLGKSKTYRWDPYAEWVWDEANAWVSPLITNMDWKQYVVALYTPGNIAYDAISLETYQDDSIKNSLGSIYYGRICIDNLYPIYQGLPEYFSVDLGQDTFLCSGSYSMVLDAEIPGEATYSWSNGTTEPKLTLSTPGIYWVEVSRKGIVVRDTIRVGFVRSPEVDLGRDTIICEGETINLSVDGAGQPLWGDGLTVSSRQVDKPGVYALTYTEAGCTSRDTIRVETRDCEQYLEMPNVFSPNNDGSNDLLLPLAKKNVVLARIQIFDRWGREMANEDLLRGWDGKSNGHPCPAGVYFYTVVYYDLLQEKHILQGSFTLLL